MIFDHTGIQQTAVLTSKVSMSDVLVLLVEERYG